MLAKILPALAAALALAEAGSPVEAVLAQLSARLSAAQAAGVDPTDTDFAMIDQAAAAALLKAKGYPSLTAALLQTPQAAPAPAAQAATFDPAS